MILEDNSTIPQWVSKICKRHGIAYFRLTCFLSALFYFFYGCDANKDPVRILEGEAQGTTYHISYYSHSERNLKSSIDSLLERIDFSVSTYNQESLLSKINLTDSALAVDSFISELFKKSEEVSGKTNGLFDITVGALVRAWGFSKKQFHMVEPAVVDSLLRITGFHKVTITNGKLVKMKPGIQLDFNAIAQGYSVDKIGELLERFGVQNYLVELGGEVLAKGKKQGGEKWKIGIDRPDVVSSEGRIIYGILELENRGLATSGSYRNFYVKNGRKYPHIINPHTGYPVNHQLLSATVTAPDAVTADAYATAFMVMGLAQTKDFLFHHPELELEAYLIYQVNDQLESYHTDGLEKDLEEIR